MTTRTRNRLVAGVGINDAPYQTQAPKQGFICPIYARWSSMLHRCYSLHRQETQNPTYSDCEVTPEWHVFSNFHRWHTEQAPLQGHHLDKDLKVWENRVYSPETCCFVSLQLNNALLLRYEKHSDLPPGVFPNKGRYTSRIGLGGDTRKILGTFDTPELAYQAYLLAKAQYLLTFIPEHKKLEPWIISRAQKLEEIAYQL